MLQVIDSRMNDRHATFYNLLIQHEYQEIGIQEFINSQRNTKNFKKIEI